MCSFSGNDVFVDVFTVVIAFPEERRRLACYYVNRAVEWLRTGRYRAVFDECKSALIADADTTQVILTVAVMLIALVRWRGRWSSSSIKGKLCETLWWSR